MWYILVHKTDIIKFLFCLGLIFTFHVKQSNVSRETKNLNQLQIRFTFHVEHKTINKMKNFKFHALLFTGLSIALTLFVGAYHLQKLIVLIPLAFMVAFGSYITTELRK